MGFLQACSSVETNSTATGVDAGAPTPTGDAGIQQTHPDAGTHDAGPTDSGIDAGPSDAGSTTPPLGAFTTLTDSGMLPAPDEVVTPGNGLPSSFIDAQHDAAGNLWAVTPSHLMLRRAGFIAWESFGPGDGLSGQTILSVGGGVEGTAWVGYKGIGDGDETDPPEWRYTGGADKVELTSTGIKTSHYEFIAPPGTYSQYPEGRYKLRRTLRAYPTKTGQFAGDAWFGANHGVAEVNAAGQVIEHHHPLLCVWDPALNDCSTTHEGDVPAVGFYANGNLLFGGSYGIGSLDYVDGKAGGDFWGPEPIHNQTLFAHPLEPNENGSEDIVGVASTSDGSVWAVSHHSGLAHLHKDGKIDVFQEAQGLPSNHIEDMAVDSTDHLWLATTGKGLFRIDLHTGRFQQATGLPSALSRRVVFEAIKTGGRITAIVNEGIAIYAVP
jgi:hypothetical protein